MAEQSARAIPGKVRSGFPFGIATKKKAIPGKVRSGFPFGIATNKKAIPGKVRSGFPPGIAHKQIASRQVRHLPSFLPNLPLRFG
ncbi:hypothetical protein [Mesorhizobium captivum]|uniref:hypothetical protein n=1 Tax=Mesorhizobium captivum TaxID=3072319 RepID=UPI002A240308|nr:hypothetical protein [Mesorhizobium sp. VK23E]MDX8513682.1 hypothetical protein [Mesorhizobium sp. VK23E]